MIYTFGQRTRPLATIEVIVIETVRVIHIVAASLIAIAIKTVIIKAIAIARAITITIDVVATSLITR